MSCRGRPRVVGFYSLASTSVGYLAAPVRVRRGAAKNQPLPAMLLARLAVTRSEQGSGLGTALLKNAMLQTAAVADIVGLRALLVHAQNAEARAWYERFHFEPTPGQPLHLMLLMKDLKASLRAS